MIVKNESSVITRCLESVRPIIDYWVIIDTGSTDGTQKIICDHMTDIPGTLYERPWRDFAFNRTESLTLSHRHGDYSLIIDADDTLEIPPDFKLQLLTADAYSLNILDYELSYTRIQLVNNRLEWIYHGVIHEYITCSTPHTNAHISLIIHRNHDGARRKNPETYQTDAAILKIALETESDPFLRSRYTFYLAQSYRDSHNLGEAIRYYQLRATLGGWVEEIFYSLYQAGKLKEQLAYSSTDILETYNQATKALPSRNEARHASAKYCRLNKLYHQGYTLAKEGLNLNYSSESLFGEPWIYETGLLDEFAVNAYWAEKYSECLEACIKILVSGKVREQDIKRIADNAHAALLAIASTPCA